MTDNGGSDPQGTARGPGRGSTAAVAAVGLARSYCRGVVEISVASRSMALAAAETMELLCRS